MWVLFSLRRVEWTSFAIRTLVSTMQLTQDSACSSRLVSLNWALCMSSMYIFPGILGVYAGEDVNQAFLETQES